MKRQSGVLRLVSAVIGMLVFSIAASAQHATVRLNDDSDLTETTTRITGKLPVLFVHGHNLGSSNDADNNYRKNWQNSVNNLPSFQQALNDGLGIEPYYIKFTDQTRSISDDAAEIADAIDLILHRHDPDHYPYPYDPAQTTNVKVVIIAYSKGTISARLYLKSIQPPLPAQPPRANFHPVSEFIAISPPNHGLSAFLFDDTVVLPLQQLHNGFRPGNIVGVDCGEAFETDLTAAHNYIENLNGHPTQDTSSLDASDVYPDEAPGSRANSHSTPNGPVLNPPTDGVLYVTIFSSGNRDSVGGDTESNDCQGRRLAKNLSPNAVNIAVSNIPGGLVPALVHENTVHVPEVICKALYAAVHHRSPEGQMCRLTSEDNNDNIIPTIPPPTRAAAMLTLDFSGSMGIRPCPNCPTRAEELQSAVALFINLWKVVMVPSDRLGVTYFRTNVDRFLPPANSNEPPPFLSDSGTDIINNVDLQAPHDLTAMGGGLQQSLDSLSHVTATATDTPVRRVILLTDGMQNVDPLVGPDGNFIASTPQTNLDTLGIPIDTIGIGAGGSFLQLLQNISSSTAGRHLSTSDPGADLRQFFVESLINALKNFSPQLVAYRRAALGSGGSGTEDFTIEDGARKLVLELSWKRGDSFNFSVAKDGVDVTKSGQFIDHTTHKIFVLNLPSQGITARGNWQLRIKGKAGTPYETAAIIDGERISYDAMFNVQRPRAGDALDLVVRLSADGQPIRRQVKVRVDWKSPKVTVGDLISKYKPKEPPAAEPGASAAERQILALANDPRAWAELRPKTQKEQLKANDKGEYRKQFRPKIPGVYTAVVTIEGDDAKLGKFRRTLTVTTVVGFANAKLKSRDTWVSEITSAGLRNVSITLSPRDKDGHRMGPGLSSSISLVSAGGKVSGIKDLGDGSYLVMLALIPGEDPAVSLNIAGGTVFTGKLSKLPRK